MFRIVVAVVVCVAVANCTILEQARCSSTEDCGVGHCCTISRQRYPIPTCLPMGGEGAPCIPTEKATTPMNTTVHYPNGNKIEVVNAYDLMCPCQSGFVCTRASATCKAINKS